MSGAEDLDATFTGILAAARAHLGMDVAWMSEFDAGRQVFSHVDAAVPGQGPAARSSAGLAGSYCVRVLDGRLPGVVADARAHPVTRELEVTAELGIGAYVGVPIPHEDGTVRGMLCCTSAHADPALAARDLSVLQMLAGILGELTRPYEHARTARAERRARVVAAIAGTGRHHVLQPIVDVVRGVPVGAEALARFSDAPFRPDAWFVQAEEVGLRLPLEFAAAATALTSLDGHPDLDYLSINLSPDAILDPVFGTLLQGADRSRIVLEITEHAPVEDYDALARALHEHRSAGLRLAVDDAGAGYASFRHILKLRPDYIKVDLSLVRDIHLDPVRQALTESIVTFSRTVGAALVAEGVETQEELDTLARLGVTLMQGYLLSPPCREPAWEGYTTLSPHVFVEDGTELSLVLARAVQERPGLDALSRPLLDATLRLTGLETSYIALLSPDGEQLAHPYVRNAGQIRVPEGAVIPWSQSLCSSMHEQRLLWTADAGRDLDNRSLTEEFGVRTYVSAPIVAPSGRLVGTLCAGSRRSIHLSPAVIAQVQLIAQILGGQVESTEASRQGWRAAAAQVAAAP